MAKNNPFEVFRKYQAAMLAVFGVLIILVFTVGDSLMQLGGGGGGGATREDPVVFTWVDGDVRRSDLEKLRNRHELVAKILERLQATSLAKEGLSREYINQLLGQPALAQRRVVHRGHLEEEQLIRHMMLMREAERLGMSAASDEEVRAYLGTLVRSLQNPEQTMVSFPEMRPLIQGPPGTSVDEFFRLVGEAITARRVETLSQRGFGNLPPGEQLAYYARIEQQLATELVAVPVEAFLDDVADPSEEQLRAYYDRHKSELAEYSVVSGTPLPSPEVGFRRPYRAAIEYVRFGYEDFVERAREIIEEDEEGIREFYERNKAMDEELQVPKGSAESDAESTEGDASEEADAAADGDQGEAAAEGDETAESGESTASAGEGETDESGEDQAEASETAAAEPGAEETTSEDATDDANVDAGTDASAAADDAETPSATETDAETPSATETDASTTDEAASADAESTDAETADAETADAETADAEPVEYRPLEEVRDYVVLRMAELRAAELIDESLGNLQDKLDDHFRYRDLSDQRGMESFVTDSTLEVKRTDPLTEEEFYETTEIGRLRGFAKVVFGQQGESSIKRPVRLRDLDNNNFLFWKIEEEEEKELPFDDMREEVATAWKLGAGSSEADDTARRRALQAAELIASQLKDGADLDEVVEANPGTRIVRPEPFSWYSVPAAPSPTGLPELALSTIEDVNAPGPEFMQKAYSLGVGEVGVAMNHPQTVAYVIRVTDRNPTDEELRADFIARYKENRLPLEDIRRVLGYDLNEVVDAWYDDLEREFKVRYARN